MPDMPRTKFNSPWTVENIETELNGTKNARGNLTMTEKLAQKVETSTYATDKAAIDAEIAEDRAALAALADKGAKNLAPNTAKSETVSTVSFTVNSDGTVLANGTASTAAWFMTAENLTLQPGTYVISGGQKADGTVNVRVVFSTSETAADIIADSNGESTEFAITSATTANIYVRMSTGRTANNVTVCPMICTKAEWDISHAYVPYAPTNRELYEMILALQSGTRSLSMQRETLTKGEEPETESREEER